MCAASASGPTGAHETKGKTMDSKSKEKLEAAGWVVGDAEEFLGLSEAESEFIKMKLALARNLKDRRLARRLNQTQVAKIVGSSQSRVAKMEAADPTVSVDLLIRSFLKLGATRTDVAEAVSNQFDGAR
jgi:predicted XRE-type DNA-binding protein